MSDEEVVSPSLEDRIAAKFGLSEPAKPEPQKPEASVQDVPADGQEPTPATETPSEPPLVEIEFRGGKYQLPPELKELHDGYLRQEDYTRKTQEAAEMRKTAELTLQQAQHQQALQAAVQPFVEALIGTNNQLAQYQRVDWNQLADQDPTAANKHWIAYQSLKDRKQQIEGQMHSAAQQHKAKLDEATRRLREENSKILESKVKGWNKERDQKVREFATKNYGFSETEVSQLFDARVLRLLSDAHDWHALQASKPQLNKVVSASPTLKPSATSQQSARSAAVSDIKKDIRKAKTDSEKARHVERLFATKL